MNDLDAHPPSGRRRHLAAGAALATVAEVGPFASAGLLSIVLARAVGPSGNGGFALAVTLISLAALIFSLGLSSGLTYEVSRGLWSARRALTQTYPLALVLGVIGAAASIGFYALTRHSVMHAISEPVAAIGAIAIPSLLVWQFAAAILLGRDRYEGYSSLQLTSAAAMLLAAAGLAIPFGLTGAIIGYATSVTVTAIVGVALVRRHIVATGVPDPNSERAEYQPLRRALRFGLTSWMSNILQQVNYRFDVIILGAYASTAHVGIYAVALTLTSIAWFLPHGIQTVIFPRTADLHAAAQAGEVSTEENDSAVTRGTRHSVLLLLPSGAVVAMLLALVPVIYGSRFEETVALGFVLLPGVLALGVGKVLASVVAGRGAVRYNLYTSAITACVTLGLYFWLIPRYGAWGAAAASSLSYFATALVVVAFFKRQLRIPLADVLIPTAADLRNYPEALAALAAHIKARGYNIAPRVLKRRRGVAG